MYGAIAGWLLLSLGGFISLLNFHLSFTRYLYHRLRRRRKEEYRFISGFPFIGQLLCLLSLLFFDTPSYPQLIAIIAALLDTGGFHWFIGALLWDRLRGTDETG
jgi:amino acid transporter